VHFVEPPLEVAVDQHLHGADQALERGPVAVVDHLRHDRAAHAIDEPEALVADGAVLDLDALRDPLFMLMQHHAQQVGVQAAAKALVCRE